MAVDQAGFDSAMQTGHDHAWEERWSEAIEAYRGAAEIDPRNPLARTSLALALFQDDQLQEALQEYLAVMELQPKELSTRRRLAEIYRDLGRISEAVEAFRELARAYQSAASTEAAIEAWRELVRLAPEDEEARRSLAEAYAESLPSAAVREYLLLARYAHSGGEAERARQYAERALYLQAENAEAQRLLSRLDRGEAPTPPPTMTIPVIEVPKTASEDKIEEQPPAEVDEEQPRPRAIEVEPLLRERQEVELAAPEGAREPPAAGPEAAEPAERPAPARKVSIPHVPGTGPVERGLRSALDRLADVLTVAADTEEAGTKALRNALDDHSGGDLERAVTWYREAMEAGVAPDELRLVMGALFVERGELDQAAAVWEGLETPEYLVAGRYGVARAYLKARDEAAAYPYLVEALLWAEVAGTPGGRDTPLIEPNRERWMPGLDEDLAPRALVLARLFQRESWAEEIAGLRSQLDALTDDGFAISLAEILELPNAEALLETIGFLAWCFRNGRPRTALETSYRALQVVPGCLPLHALLGEMFARTDHIEEAVAKYETIGDTYLVRGELVRAVDAYRRASDLAPLGVGMRIKLVDLLSAQGIVDAALEEQQELADAYYRLARPDDSIKTLEAGLALAESSPTPDKWRARILRQKADLSVQRAEYQAALDAYRQVVELEPGDAGVRLALAELLFRLDRPDEAVASISELVPQTADEGEADEIVRVLMEAQDRSPDNQALKKLVSDAYLAAGRPDKAIAALDALGEAQLAAGDSGGAADTIRQIISLGPEDRAGYEKLLAQLEGQS